MKVSGKAYVRHLEERIAELQGVMQGFHLVFDDWNGKILKLQDDRCYLESKLSEERETTSKQKGIISRKNEELSRLGKEISKLKAEIFKLKAEVLELKQEPQETISE